MACKGAEGRERGGCRPDREEDDEFLIPTRTCSVSAWLWCGGEMGGGGRDGGGERAGLKVVAWCVEMPGHVGKQGGSRHLSESSLSSPPTRGRASSEVVAPSPPPVSRFTSLRDSRITPYRCIDVVVFVRNVFFFHVFFRGGWSCWDCPWRYAQGWMKMTREVTVTLTKKQSER